jgi:hypothetical protein
MDEIYHSFSSVDSGQLHPPFFGYQVADFARKPFSASSGFEQPPSPILVTRAASPRRAIGERKSVMAVDAISADRAAAADRREAGRTAAQQHLAMRAEARRDTRVEEAKAAIAARATPAERAAEKPGPVRMVDVLV